MQYLDATKILKLAGFLMLTLLIDSAEAEIVISPFRVIYPTQESEVGVRVDNKGDAPALVQSWIDNGDMSKAVAKEVGFLLTPPLARIEAKRSQVLRLFYTSGKEVKDRETLFYLNVLEVPAKAKGDVNHIQIGFKSRLKLFLRPKEIKMDIESAPKKLLWNVKKSKNASESSLELENATPFFMTFSGPVFTENAAFASDNVMVPPFSKASFSRLKDAPSVPDAEKLNSTEVRFSVFNDYGGVTVVKSEVGHPN